MNEVPNEHELNQQRKRPGFRAGTKLLIRVLAAVEQAGNRLPDPVTLFVLSAVVVVLASAVCSALKVQVVHPGNGTVIAAENLMTAGNVRRMFTGAVENFALFPPLGLVLVTMLGIGVAERSGLVTTALKQLVRVVPPRALTMTLVFAGVMSSLAADAGYVVLTPLGAVLFAGVGRHPLAGMAAAFAGVSGGFSANLLLTSLDPLLSGLSTTAAQILDPAYVVQPTANYYFMAVSTVFVTAAGTWVTIRLVEPHLGPWRPRQDLAAEADTLGGVAPRERRGLLAAALAGAAFVGLVAALTWPADGIFRDAEHGLAPFYRSLIPLLMLFFLLMGLSHGVAAGSIRSDRDVVRMMSEAMATMGPYIVLAFAAAQFVAYFAWSNLGLIVAVAGADALKALGLAGIPLLIAFIFVSGCVNLVVGSASAKWAIMGPVFVPMLMLMGYSPELIQAAYRVGDSATNIVTPLLPYFPIMIAFARKYEPKAGIGTLISVMIPYSVVFAIGWTCLLVAWVLLGLPLGPDAPLHYVPSMP